ncbi:hypothetical protein A2V56_01680 [Candidatus Woesebacteria bacterium RBG_19FT_COMBO_42_9]|uniref:HIT domain-containing protein n=1 Tax=Candidatus Woesebacteria bacterium RBG_16_42_24 TaxID=1802485 RepID=A0A1F7XJT3_9BACT|nr:MAG: hypothetical protein A2V97_01590 [Candidatus Woesebacteria bacterium RBG_16_42_24]OGM17538.1 MAG: hypothetical protein A2V56_01680 [Candidatus Woesebacteria bacterium RBG_19FT_COMBO_42_9]OGM67613.1 MAG: hypothetical protein A2985_00410 [Candidatus Woesebacteria bacterium RIFCSPLOWO2_01_FULL_43_11]
MQECIFCKIINKEIPKKLEAETANLLAFKDINPKAPVHLLIVPKEHVQDIRYDSGVIWASMGKLAVKLAKDKKLKSFRLVHNTGEAAAVPHMHMHLLGEVAATREV